MIVGIAETIITRLSDDYDISWFRSSVDAF